MSRDECVKLRSQSEQGDEEIRNLPEKERQLADLERNGIG